MTAWRSKAELGFFTRPFFEQLGFRIRLGFMGGVAAGLARKVAPAIAILWARVPFTLRPEAFERGPGVDQGPIDRKMFLTQQASRLEHADHFSKEFVGHLVFKQPLLVFAEGAGIEGFLLEFQVQKPLEQ